MNLQKKKKKIQKKETLKSIKRKQIYKNHHPMIISLKYNFNLQQTSFSLQINLFDIYFLFFEVIM